MNKRNEMPWFLDFETHRFKLSTGLTIGGVSGGLAIWSLGPSLLTVSYAVGVTAACVGMLYLVDYLGRKYID